MDHSLLIYQLYDPTASYTGLYKNNGTWTPEEHGKFGQGSVGDRQNKLLDADNELWMMNMMWAKGNRPPLNSKFLMSYNGRNVVVIAGFETGPSARYFLGGVTGEVHSWLKSNMNSTIAISYLADQSINAGPCNCQTGTD